MTTRTAKLGMLHALKREQALDDDTYRDKLFAVTGQRSAKDLDDGLLDKAIGALRQPAFHVKQKANNSYTAKVVALYLAAWNLGAFASGTDAAIAAFVERQTGKKALAFLTPGDANKVTEALKDICKRRGFEVPPGDAGGMEARRLLLMAQWTRLHQLGAVGNVMVEALENYISRKYLGHTGSLINMKAPQLDQAAKDFGRWIRGAQARQRAN